MLTEAKENLCRVNMERLFYKIQATVLMFRTLKFSFLNFTILIFCFQKISHNEIGCEVCDDKNRSLILGAKRNSKNNNRKLCF